MELSLESEKEPNGGVEMVAKRFVAMVLTISMILLSFNTLKFPNVDGKNGSFGGGNGSSSSPYIIEDVLDLQNMSANLGAYYILKNDIDAKLTSSWNNGKGFKPIGNQTKKFSGSLDGKKYNITNLYINRSSEKYVGLFGYISQGSSIKNVNLKGCKIFGNDLVGGIVGYSYFGKVMSCSAIGNITGYKEYIGGLVGYNQGTGGSDGTTSKSFTKGNVKGPSKVGGLVGFNSGGIISDSYSMAELDNEKKGGYLGGLLGYNERSGKVYQSYATGNVKGSGSCIGGLIGYSESGTISNSNACGNVKGNMYIGGLVGWNGLLYYGGSTVTDCFALGNVSGRSEGCGGLIGYNCDSQISNSYAVGNITGSILIGGLIGRFSDSYVSNSHYCVNYSRINNEKYLTPYGIYSNQFNDWLKNKKTLKISNYLSYDSNMKSFKITCIDDVKNMLPFATFEKYNYSVRSNIDFSYDPGLYIYIFNGGIFDGNGKQFKNVNLTKYQNYDIGVFGFVKEGGTIKNLILNNVKISGLENIGGLIGNNFGGQVINCSVNGCVKGNDSIGGLIGRNAGFVKNSFSNAKVGKEGFFDQYIGGIIGYNEGTIERCFALGQVDGCTEIGGLIGQNSGEVYDSYARGNVSGTLTRAGGLIGYHRTGKISRCYASGNVVLPTKGFQGEYAGGLVGLNCDRIENTFAYGNVSGKNNIGGLVGKNAEGWQTFGNITNSYSIGKVVGTSNVGGLIGDNDKGTVIKCFWNNQTSGLTASDGGTGKNTSTMKKLSTFIAAGWDFKNIWWMKDNVNYPVLIRLINDKELPIFGKDSTQSFATTGDPFQFIIAVTDNICVFNVTVEYWFGSGLHSTVEMVNNNGYNQKIQIPLNMTNNLQYIFHAIDAVGNQNNSGRKQIIVKDNDKPIFENVVISNNGTTGDPFKFNISVNDNTNLSSVYVEFWFGNEEHKNNSMLGINPFFLNITLPSNSTDTMYYLFHANDSSGNWAETNQYQLLILDNDRPVFGIQSTPSFGMTGNSFIFNISVYDNIGISSVFVEYWFGNGIHMNKSMNGTNPYTYNITIPLNSIEILYYSFHAIDTTGNWKETFIKEVQIIDNDRPIFLLDSTLKFGKTGDPLIFNISVYDNIKIKFVYLEYWFGDEIHFNVTMFQKKDFIYQIWIPSNSTERLYYKFHAIDSFNNWEHTFRKEIIVIDNDNPRLDKDSTPNEATTGEKFIFNISTSDNIRVSNVYVEYWYYLNEVMNVSMVGEGPYLYQITIPSNSIDSMNYFFHIVDPSGNWEQTNIVNIGIKDNDAPIFEKNSTLACCSTGQLFTINVSISDNIGLKFVFLEYWFGQGTHTNVSMEGNGNFTYIIIIPNDSLENLYYLIYTEDYSSNGASICGITKVVDGINPTALIGPDRSVDEGSIVEFDGSRCTDNIGIKNFTWKFEYIGKEIVLFGISTSFIFDKPDDYSIQLVIRDSAGLIDKDEMNLTVNDITNPIAIAGMDMKVPIGTKVSFNGSLSTDNGMIIMYSWTFKYENEKNVINEREFSFIFDIGGTYEILLTVTDFNNNKDEDKLILIVIETGIVEGVILDESGKPVVNATFKIIASNGNNYSTMTGFDGNFSIEIFHGPFAWEISKQGYKTLSGSGSVDAMGTSILDLTGTPLLMNKGSKDGSMIWFIISLIILVLSVMSLLIFLFVRNKKEEFAPITEKIDVVFEEPKKLEKGSSPIENGTPPPNVATSIQIVSGHEESPIQDHSSLIEEKVHNALKEDIEHIKDGAPNPDVQ